MSLTRRDFLKASSALAAAFGVKATGWLDGADALAATGPPPVI